MFVPETRLMDFCLTILSLFFFLKMDIKEPKDKACQGFLFGTVQEPGETNKFHGQQSQTKQKAPSAG